MRKLIRKFTAWRQRARIEAELRRLLPLGDRVAGSRIRMLADQLQRGPQ